MNELLISLVAGVVGSYLTYYFTNKSKRNDAIIKYKEEKYSKLLLKLQGFVGVTTNGKTKREFFEEQYQSWLYCSDEVVHAMNHMVNLVIENHDKAPNPEEGRKAVGNIVLAMRKDLLGKTSLDYKAFRYTDVLPDNH
jgi:hypothetical protein